MRHLLLLAATATFGMGLFGQNSFAGFSVQNTFTYDSETIAPESGAESEDAAIRTDWKFGWEFPGGFVIGGVYHMVTASDINDDALAKNRTGVLFGYNFASGWYTHFTYYLTALEEIVAEGALETSYREGSGYQFDVGYIHMFNSWFGLGPQLTYESLTFTERTLLTVESEFETVVTQIKPQIALKFQF